jgi:uncharacterized membrane protein
MAAATEQEVMAAGNALNALYAALRAERERLQALQAEGDAIVTKIAAQVARVQAAQDDAAAARAELRSLLTRT